ncbi:MAG: RNA 2',3'-cyclic phosphodiesterase [Theionarchaea archaeon]|nr:RNA 2',3'-cyclic phosphodiesterase [Theionarchaea archaeon]MBU7037955.1 RNA 2',3'-cyclic phosphodiesterase [Theionarchaea archaeon]
MRSFIAVDLAEELIPTVVDIQTHITEGKIKFVEPENLHFTVKFLGDITEKKGHDVTVKLKEICSAFKPFPITLKTVGAFPSLDYMKVVWVGVESEEFFSLSRLVDSGMGRLGFKQERNLVPHLTIGRVKFPGNKAVLKTQVEALAEVRVGDMMVDTIRLKKSELTKKGPIYTDIEEIRL